MSNFCPRILHVFLIITLFLSFLVIKPSQTYAQGSCGNGNCQSGESCSTCPADCGACPDPTTAPTDPPTATATSAPGQPTSNPAPTSSSSSSDSSSSSSSTNSSVTYYPSVTLNAYSPNPTNKVPLTFSGKASVEQGKIVAVEYTITEGASWIPVSSSDGSFDSKEENFTFTTAKLAEGKYSVKVRAKSDGGVYTQDGSYAISTVTIATTPPKVTLDIIAPNPTNNQTPTLTGTAIAKLVDIAKFEISVDDGKSWQAAKRFGNIFSLTLTKLEDGNYPVKARAFDSAGNIGQSDTQALIIDTIPPIIGGGMQSLGPQILTPDKNGMVSVVAGTETTIAMSMKGGVTAAEIMTDTGTFRLTPKEGTNLWVGKIKFEPPAGGQEEEKPLTISAVDGAGNSTERKYNTLTVVRTGTIEDKKTKQVIESAEISLYYYETVSQKWILWEAQSYGQSNPQKTDRNGSYSFMVPNGKYYIEVNAFGYNSLLSDIISVPKTTILNYLISLSPKPTVEFTLPFIGKVVLTVPSLSAPETFPVPQASFQKQPSDENASILIGTPASDFSLPNLDNIEVKLADFKGKKLLLTFIAPWSSLSLEQAPFLTQASSSLKESQAALVVSLQESTATTQTMMKKGNYGFSVVADKDGNTASKYMITLLPHHVFIDANGNIRDTFTGVLTSEELMEKLSSIP